MQLVRKAWGTETVLVNNESYCAKELRIYPGKRCSLHYHKIKKETFIVESGLVRLECGCADELLKPGEERTIEPKTPHRFSSTHGAVILEVSTHHDDSDVVRLEPSGDIQEQVLAGHSAD